METPTPIAIFVCRGISPELRGGDGAAVNPVGFAEGLAAI